MKHLRKFNEDISQEEDPKLQKSSGKFKVVFDGFETEEQAIEFADWFEGQGEQDASNWLDGGPSGMYSVNTNMNKLHSMGGFKSNENGEIIVPVDIYVRD